MLIRHFCPLSLDKVQKPDICYKKSIWEFFLWQFTKLLRWYENHLIFSHFESGIQDVAIICRKNILMSCLCNTLGVIWESQTLMLLVVTMLASLLKRFECRKWHVPCPGCGISKTCNPVCLWVGIFAEQHTGDKVTRTWWIFDTI